MKFRMSWSHRRGTVAALVLLAALSVSVSVAFAGGGGGGSKITVPMYKHDNSCGLKTKGTTDGKVTFSQGKGGLLTITVDLHGADPGTYYIYTYYDADSLGNCYYWGDSHKFEVDASGDGHVSYTLTGTNGYNNWLVYGYSDSSGLYDDSAQVHLNK